MGGGDSVRFDAFRSSPVMPEPAGCSAAGALQSVSNGCISPALALRRGWASAAWPGRLLEQDTLSQRFFPPSSCYLWVILRLSRTPLAVFSFGSSSLRPQWEGWGLLAPLGVMRWGEEVQCVPRGPAISTSTALFLVLLFVRAFTGTQLQAGNGVGALRGHQRGGAARARSLQHQQWHHRSRETPL